MYQRPPRPSPSLSLAGHQQALRPGVSVIMAEKSCTIRTRKFMTNKLLMRRQFVSLRTALAHLLSAPEEPLLRSPPNMHATLFPAAMDPAQCLRLELTRRGRP